MGEGPWKHRECLTGTEDSNGNTVMDLEWKTDQTDGAGNVIMEANEWAVMGCEICYGEWFSYEEFSIDVMMKLSDDECKWLTTMLTSSRLSTVIILDSLVSSSFVSSSALEASLSVMLFAF